MPATVPYLDTGVEAMLNQTSNHFKITAHLGEGGMGTVFLETHGNVSFYHYDPYAQLLSKVVRDFLRDLEDAEHFLASGMVQAESFRSLVQEIPETEYAKYPALSREAVLEAVEGFLSRTRS